MSNLRILFREPFRVTLEFNQLQRNGHDEKEIGVDCDLLRQRILFCCEQDWTGDETQQRCDTEDTVLPFVDQEETEEEPEYSCAWTKPEPHPYAHEERDQKSNRLRTNFDSDLLHE